MRILPLVVIAALAAPALADPPTEIVGRVLDNTKKHPVVGATVTVGGFTTTTNGNGLYHLNVPAGTYAGEISMFWSSPRS